MSEAYIKIDSIKASKRNFFTIKIDGQAIELHTDTVIKYQLLNKPPLKKATYDAIIKENHYNTLMQKAIDLLGRKHYSAQALKTALMPYTETTKYVNQVVTALEDLGYINDEKALKMRMEEYLNFELKGPGFIKQKLKKEGFDSFLIEDALKQFSDDLQSEKIQKLITQDATHLQNFPVQKQREKLYAALMRKGFDSAIIKREINAFIETSKSNTDETTLIDKRIHHLKNKYDLKDYKEKQKCIQKLLREGFSYDLIKRQL